MKNRKFLQLFAFDGGNYCDFSSTAAKALAGKDILLAIYNSDGSRLIAISGQQGLTINRSADSIEITSKDTEGGWKSKIAGMKEWSIDNDGLYVLNDESHRILSEAFDNGDPVCIKVVNAKKKQGMFGGLATITDYPIEAPYDDAVTYSLTLEGMGALVDLLVHPATPDTMPQGSAAIEPLTVVSVAGEVAGNTVLYVNPVLVEGNQYRYTTGSTAYPGYEEDCSDMTEWDGSTEITVAAGTSILLVECNESVKALKAGMVKAIVKEN